MCFLKLKLKFKISFLHNKNNKNYNNQLSESKNAFVCGLIFVLFCGSNFDFLLGLIDPNSALPLSLSDLRFEL